MEGKDDADDVKACTRLVVTMRGRTMHADDVKPSHALGWSGGEGRCR